MKEFPKALYKNGPTGEMITVDSSKEEFEARSKGYTELSEADYEENKTLPSLKTGESDALVDPVKTTLAAEKPEDGNIYSTSGSAPTPDFPFPDSRETVEKTTRPVGRPRKE